MSKISEVILKAMGLRGIALFVFCLSTIVASAAPSHTLSNTPNCFAADIVKRIGNYQDLSQSNIFLSPNKKWLVFYNSTSNKLIIFNTKDLTSREVPLPSSNLTLSMNSDNQIVYNNLYQVAQSLSLKTHIALDKMKLEYFLYALKKTKTFQINLETLETKQLHLPEGHAIIENLEVKDIHIVDPFTIAFKTPSGQENRFFVNLSGNELPYLEIQGADTLPNKLTYRAWFDQNLNLHIVRNGKQVFNGAIPIESKTGYYYGFFSRDLSQFAVFLTSAQDSSRDHSSKIMIFDFNKQQERSSNSQRSRIIEFEKNMRPHVIDNSSYIVLQNQDYHNAYFQNDPSDAKLKFKVIDIFNKQDADIEWFDSDFFISDWSQTYFDEASSQICYFASKKTGLYFSHADNHRCLDLKTHKIDTSKSFILPFRSSARSRISNTDFFTTYLGLPHHNDSDVELFQHKTFCFQPTSSNSNISSDSIRSTLQQMSHPNSPIEPDIRFNSMVQILRQGGHWQEPAIFKTALENLLSISPVFYESLLKRFSELQIFKPDIASDHSHLSKQEVKILNQGILAYIEINKEKLKKSPITKYAPLWNLIRSSHLSEAVKAELADSFADDFVELAADDSTLHTIFASKIHKFSENKIREAIGLPFENLTDFTAVHDFNEVNIYQLGHDPFVDAIETPLGFYLKHYSQVSLNQLRASSNNQKISFYALYNSNQYRITIDLKTIESEKPITPDPRNPSPDYNRLFADPVFSGVVVIGSNFSESLLNATVNQYRAYFEKEGFTFSEPQLVENTLEELKNKTIGIQNSPMHYFIKEAHSDGDEKNLFRMNLQNLKLHAVRKINTKQIETIDLYFPNISQQKVSSNSNERYKNSYSILLSNKEFGSWIQLREKQGGPELVYINSSCWSLNKAKYEISAASSPLLIDIPTVSVAGLFSNSDYSVMRAIVHGLRNRKTYEEIRTAMKADKQYERKEKNVFIFPDESAYKTNILELMKKPIMINVQIDMLTKQSTWVPYSLENMNLN